MSSPLRKFKSPVQDFPAMVLVFKPHFFTWQFSCIRFLAYHSEKARNKRIENITVTTIWVRFTWRVLLVCVRFLQPWQVTCNVVLTLCFKVFMPSHMLYRCSVFVFFVFF